MGKGSPSVTDYGFDIAELSQYVIDFYCDSAWANRIKSVEVWYDDYLVHEFINEGKRFSSEEWKHGIQHWPEEAAHLKERPVQYWNGWAHDSDRVCKRKRIGE